MIIQLRCVLFATLAVLPSCRRAPRDPDPVAVAATRDSIRTFMASFPGVRVDSATATSAQSGR